MASSPMWISRWEPMATRRERPTIRRKAVLLLRITAVLVVVGGLGLAWVANWPSISKACTVAASIDEVGAATPEAARIRWARKTSLDVDIEDPDRTSGSGDHVTVVLMAILVAIGSPGLPGASIVLMVFILEAFGIPLEGIAIILATDRVLDMCRTVVNVAGDACAAVVVAGKDRGTAAAAARA